jgi:hypothetical protein
MINRVWISMIAVMSVFIFGIYAALVTSYGVDDVVQNAVQMMPTTAGVVAIMAIVCAGINLLFRREYLSEIILPAVLLVLAACVDLVSSAWLSPALTLIASLGIASIAAYLVVNAQTPRRLGLGVMLSFSLQMLAFWGGCMIISTGRPIVDPIFLVAVSALIAFGIERLRKNLQAKHDADLVYRPDGNFNTLA